MTSLRTLIAILFVVSSATLLHAQSIPPPTNSGTDFLLCFERNDIPSHSAFDSGKCEIYMANSDPAQNVTVTITCRYYPKMSQQFTIPPKGYKTYRITDDWPDIWINGGDSAVDDRVVRVTATVPIVCYGMNYKLNTCDAFMAIPASASGTDYRIMSYGTSSYVVSAMPSQFAVAAFYDNTTVTIIPSCATASSQSSHPATGHVAGVPFSVTLMAGQCIQVQADQQVANSDLTGTVVYSDSVVAVYGGHARAEVPFNFYKPGISGSTSRDVLIEQMPPTDSWGKTFILSAIDSASNNNSPRKEGDVLRVLALNDSTQVSLNGLLWRTLQANGFADTMIFGPIVVEATGPVLVGEYAHTTVSLSGDNGDPFLAIIPSIDQTFNDYPFFVSDDPVFATQKVIIAADSLCTADITIDDTLIPSQLFVSLPISTNGRSFGLSQLNVSPGAHRLSTTHAPNNGFTILGYGLGYVVSYGYTAGALLKPLRAVSIFPPSPLQIAKHEVTFRNTTGEKVLIDSIRFTPFVESDQQYGVRPMSQIAGGLAVGGSGTIQFTATSEPTKSIAGRLRIYSHTTNWKDLEAAEVRYIYSVGSSGGASVSNSSDDGNIILYPNPARSVVTVETDGQAGVVILMDALGRELERQSISPKGSLQFDVRHLTPGAYYVTVGNKAMRFVREE